MITPNCTSLATSSSSTFTRGQSGSRVPGFTGRGRNATRLPAFWKAAVPVWDALVMLSAKLTRVGGTSSSLKLPDMESLPPMEGTPSSFWARNAPRSAAAGLPHRSGTSRSRSKYSWKVSLADSGSAPMAARRARDCTTA